MAVAADAVPYGISIAFSLTMGHSTCAFAIDDRPLPWRLIIRLSESGRKAHWKRNLQPAARAASAAPAA
jgi:hypothetical protein